MNWELLLQSYFVIGIIYWVVNVFIRKIDIEDDYGISFMWVFLWWVCFVALLIQFIQRVKHKL